MGCDLIKVKELEHFFPLPFFRLLSKVFFNADNGILLTMQNRVVDEWWRIIDFFVNNSILETELLMGWLLMFISVSAMLGEL